MTTLQQWTQYLQATGASQGTIKIRTQTIRSIQTAAGLADALDIKRQHVIAYLGRPLSPWSRLTYYKCAEAWSAYLRAMDIDPGSDLTRGIPRPRKPAPVARPISDDVIDALLAGKFTNRPHAYIRLALFQALRVHEIAKVRGQDFDWRAGWMTVHGKGGHTASIPIHPEIRRLAHLMPEIGLWFPSPANPYVCVSAQSVTQTVRAALLSVGSPATAHQLRDTALTRMQREQGDIRVTQTFARHLTIASTQKYTAVADSALQAAVLQLDWSRPAA